MLSVSSTSVQIYYIDDDDDDDDDDDNENTGKTTEKGEYGEYVYK